jgi:hypothetical protein
MIHDMMRIMVMGVTARLTIAGGTDQFAAAAAVGEYRKPDKSAAILR